jgi:hypothetical protein
MSITRLKRSLKLCKSDKSSREAWYRENDFTKYKEVCFKIVSSLKFQVDSSNFKR